MRQLPLTKTRRWFFLALSAMVALAVIWHFSPGLPVLIGPWARASTRDAGRELFLHEWEANDPLARGDGLGPVFNARSCVACHNQGGPGGGGGNEFNVVNFEVKPNSRDRHGAGGTIHAAATSPAFQESFELVRKKFPVIPGGSRVENHCTIFVPPEDPLSVDSVQTTALFGAGWIDRISDKAITANRRGRLLSGVVREFHLDFDGIPSGRPRLLSGNRIGKFGWRAQFATLEEFVAAACANELGLGTPTARQAVPLSRPDYPEVEPDLSRKQFRQLVAFVDTLPKPVEILPADGPGRDQAIRGKAVFTQIGCAVCHVPDLGGVRGVYSDFLLHRIADGHDGSGGSGAGSYGVPIPESPPLPDDELHPNEFKTPPLWGVADSAPYFHDGSAATLDAAIQRHGGSARSVREAYRNLPASDQQALIAFLNTLKAPPAADVTAR